ncbi:helix-turn-helix domain-containing protein [Chitinophaga polysaccharea]|nr:helix-turn-helix domain-containing protein [Chitinophaga polysaccharea]
MKEVLQGILVRLELIEQKLDKLQKAPEPLQHYLAAEQLLSAKETAAYLHLSVARIYCLVCEGRLKPLQRKKRGRILFSQSLLDDYLSVNPITVSDFIILQSMFVNKKVCPNNSIQIGIVM